MDDKENEYRLELIRDSLIGVTYHLPAREVILFPFLDNLLLLQQAPLVFAFWKEGKCVCSSLKDPDYLAQHNVLWRPSIDAITLPGTGYKMSVHSFAESAASRGGEASRIASCARRDRPHSPAH